MILTTLDGKSTVPGHVNNKNQVLSIYHVIQPLYKVNTNILMSYPPKHVLLLMVETFLKGSAPQHTVARRRMKNLSGKANRN